MCQWFGWTNSERLLAYEAFHQAIIMQFNAIYGVDVNNLASWQLLCLVLQIHPVPSDLKTCRKVSASSLVYAPTHFHDRSEGTSDLRQHIRPIGVPCFGASANLPDGSRTKPIFHREREGFPQRPSGNGQSAERAVTPHLPSKI